MIYRILFLACAWLALSTQHAAAAVDDDRLRIIVTSDGEIDDQCSLVRFLLYSNEWNLEAIITSS